MDDNASGILRCGILLDAFCFQRTFIITSRPRKQKEKKRVADVSELVTFSRTETEPIVMHQLVRNCWQKLICIFYFDL